MLGIYIELCGRVTPNIFLIAQHGILLLYLISTSLAPSLLFALYAQNLPRVAQLHLPDEVNALNSASNPTFLLPAIFNGYPSSHALITIPQHRPPSSEHHPTALMTQPTPSKVYTEIASASEVSMLQPRWPRLHFFTDLPHLTAKQSRNPGATIFEILSLKYTPTLTFITVPGYQKRAIRTA